MDTDNICYAFFVEIYEMFYLLIYGFGWCLERINEMCQRQLDR